MEQVLYDWIMDYKNPQKVLNVANWYLYQKQYASATSYYFRFLNLTANIDNYKLDRYFILCKISKIFILLGDRNTSATNYFTHAICECPERIEAYILMGNLLRQEAYNNSNYDILTWLKILKYGKEALNIYNKTQTYNNELINNIDDMYILIIDGLLKTNKHIELLKFIETNNFDNASNELKELIIYAVNEYNNFNYTLTEHYGDIQKKIILLSYSDKYYNSLRFKFKNSNIIKENYSQVMQDIFVLSVLNGKENGTYVEIGSNMPEISNNTKLLEDVFNWKGIGLENIKEYSDFYNEHRKNKCYCSDATTFDYIKALDEQNICRDSEGFLDYLQCDIEPAENTFKACKKVLETGLKFRCITFEHDAYNYGDNIRNESREYLKSKGYVLVVPDVCCNFKRPFEDWWVHESIVDTLSKELFEPNINDKLYSGYCKYIFCK